MAVLGFYCLWAIQLCFLCVRQKSRISAASGNRDQENDPETDPETMQSLAHKTGVSDSTVKRELRDLVSKGWIVRIGSDRGGWWKVIKKL